MSAKRSCPFVLAFFVVASAPSVLAQERVNVLPRAVCPGGTLKIVTSIDPSEKICLFAASQAFDDPTSPGVDPVWLGVFDGPSVTLPFTFGTDVEPFEVFVQGVVLPTSGSPFRTNIAEAAVIDPTISWSITPDERLTFPAKTDWLVASDLPFTQLISVSTVPSGYEAEVSLSFSQMAPVGNGSVTMLGATLWQYTSFDDLDVDECFERTGGTEKIQAMVDGVACGDEIEAEVISVFEYLAQEIEDLQRAYQWVTSVRQEWLAGLTAAGSTLMFSSLTLELSEGIYCGLWPFGVVADACTSCLDASTIFAKGAFDTEWGLASTVLHELVHTADDVYCEESCAEYWAYFYELQFATMTLIDPCDAQHLNNSRTKFDEECPGCGASCG